MSMRSSFVYGYGFHYDCDVEKFIDFVKAHKESWCQSGLEVKLLEDLMECRDCKYDDLCDLWDCEELYESGYEFAGEILAAIMEKETGIRFIHCGPCAECNTDPAIVFDSSYPWFFNEREKNLAEDELYDICIQYMKELGLTDDPDYLDLEYFG